ncbi:hypothetical protein [Nonomuraea rhodomycinica]|uniref:Uncharacterized protein n=1 Tax=Nonomuraea rhodomycinica TaxID=1712872 RepID=A0A7Y6MDH3_9ACTN|nr:hypothetical protein [Nonomuraea rhodomycinica]NUW43892.1 hypothetical protein [Nonomuraea rhodomycinica]
MSALAGAVAAVVALIAYLAPPVPRPQPQPGPLPDTVVPTPAPESPSPDPVTTRHARPTPTRTPTRTPSPEPSTPPPPPSPTRAVPVSATPLPPIRPGGCDEAAAALTAYRRNAGTVRSSQAAAAQQAYQDLMGAGLAAQGVVGAKIGRLAREFQELSFRLTGMILDDPNEVIADINTDAAELNRLCAPA